MIRLSCEHEDVLALTEDQLIISSTKEDLVSEDIDLVYTIDKSLQRRVYVFVKYEHIRVRAALYVHLWMVVVLINNKEMMI